MHTCMQFDVYLSACLLYTSGVMICYSGGTKTYRAICGETLQQPGVVALIAARITDHHTHHEERNTDDGCSKRLVFAMPIIMVLILSLIHI